MYVCMYVIRPRTILPCYQQVNLTRARDPMEKPTLGQLQKKTRDLDEL